MQRYNNEKWRASALAAGWIPARPEALLCATRDEQQFKLSINAMMLLYTTTNY